MFEWKRSTNTTNFIDFKGPDGKSIFKNGEVTSVAVDNNGNIWATVHDDGLIVMDKNRKLIGAASQSSFGDEGLKPGTDIQLGSCMIKLPKDKYKEIKYYEAVLYEMPLQPKAPPAKTAKK